MLACLDVDYRDAGAMAACVCFGQWGDETSSSQHCAWLTEVAPYVSGEFFRRELPCLLKVLAELPQPPTLLVVDSYVGLSDGKAGMGAHLYQALGQRVPVVGVAKTQMLGAAAHEVLRGESLRPLYVTAAGIEVLQAAQHVQHMHGEHRMPTLLRHVDRLARDHKAPVD